MAVVQREGSHRVVLTVEALEAVEVAADRRLLRAELRDARGRAVRCTPSPPRTPARTVSLERGQRWSEWLDVRELCWGRALATLASVNEIRWSFDAGRARGAWVARTPSTAFRSIGPVASAWRAPPATSPDANAPIRVELAAVDLAHRARPVFRVRVVGASRGRAFVRHEAISFRVLTPSGRTFDCRLPAFGGRALPDFFARFAPGRAISMSLDGEAYCGRFTEPGIHEVTPVLTLRERGEAWGLEAVTGTFVGAPVPLRVRSRTYVEQPVE